MRPPEEVRRRNRRLDIWGYAIIALQVLAIGFEILIGEWVWAAILVLCIVVIAWAMHYRRRAYRSWSKVGR